MKKSVSNLFYDSKNRSHSRPNSKFKSGFTIVELLVVIVAIGILAAITIVSYTGISQRASVASMQSDLTNASNLLKLDQVLNSNYPTALNLANSGKGLTASTGNNFVDYQIDNSGKPQAFCLAVSNTNGVSYRIMNDSSASIGNCSRTSCLAILNANESTGDGMYWIKPVATAYQVNCDMANGGWTRILYLVDTAAKTFNMLDKGVQFTKFRAVKAIDHSIYQQATFATTQTATQGLVAVAVEANTKIMLSGPGGYGVWTGTASICSWSGVVMFGSGYDGSCGTESNLRVGRDTSGTNPQLTERFDVELFVQ